MAMVKLNGVDLNYRLEGDGDETIVLINGLADDLETWAEQMPDFLAAGYRVLRFDNRGIGKSGRRSLSSRRRPSRWASRRSSIVRPSTGYADVTR